MLIRFLDKKNRCFQISTPDTPILVYLDPDDRKRLKQCKSGECIMFVKDDLPEETINKQCDALNTTETPNILK